MRATEKLRPRLGDGFPGALQAIVFVSFCFILGACREGSASREGLITVAGSTSVQPFAEKLAESFMHAHPGHNINVQGGGSTAGVKAAKTGAAQIGMSSRHLKPDEEDLHQTLMAHDGIAIVTHLDNPVTGLSREQVAAIFAGRVERWAAVGGRDREIHFVTREEGSGTRGAFEEIVMGKLEISPRALVQDSNGAVREIIASDPDAIGYVSLGVIDHRVRAVAIDGVLPSKETITGKRYLVVRPFLFLTRGEPEGDVRDFLTYTRSPEAQRALALEGLVPAE